MVVWIKATHKNLARSINLEVHRDPTRDLFQDIDRTEFDEEFGHGRLVFYMSSWFYAWCIWCLMFFVGRRRCRGRQRTQRCIKADHEIGQSNLGVFKVSTM